MLSSVRRNQFCIILQALGPRKRLSYLRRPLQSWHWICPDIWSMKLSLESLSEISKLASLFGFHTTSAPLSLRSAWTSTDLLISHTNIGGRCRAGKLWKLIQSSTIWTKSKELTQTELHKLGWASSEFQSCIQIIQMYLMICNVYLAARACAGRDSAWWAEWLEAILTLTQYF